MSRPYDRLTGGEKGALVRVWQRLVLLAGRQAPDGHPARLRDLVVNARDAEAFAQARAAYLGLVEQAWFRLAWTMGEPAPDPYLPAHLLVGTTLDEVLTELHPGNLLDELAERRGAA